MTESHHLEPPAGRQGPGPMPQGLIDRLGLGLVRRTARGLPGDLRSASVGAGTELALLRTYEPGDDVRNIDAASTARTGEPHVRLHVPERTHVTWIVLDVSPSMAFGTTTRLKADVAEGAALVIGRLGVRRAGSLGLVTFGAGRVHLHPPRSSKPGMLVLRRILAEGVGRDGHRDPHALAHALREIGMYSRAPGLVSVISDFRDQEDWVRPLTALRARHAVLAVEISDPRESELPAAGRLLVVDPESGETLEVDTSRRVRKRFAAIEAERRTALVADLRRARVDHAVLSTDGDWLLELGRRLR
ncbi:MAG: hypothetical protein QOD61_2102 [Solirubrobacteraceae bacterium]|nr:hypothetical protein [Solirubrobacteraceae bacterium]